MNRRDFLKIAALSSFSTLSSGARGWTFSNGDIANKRLIVVLLRGGIDGLNVVAPYGDSHYAKIRPTIALSKSDGLIDLDGYFGLHPAMAPLLPLWQAKSLAFVHSCGSPDPTRSHFDAQDYMESGLPGRKAASTGWLNRLVSQMPSKHSPVQAISVGPVLPRICAGPASIATVSKAIDNKTRTIIDHPQILKVFDDMYSGLNDDLGRAYREAKASTTAINDILAENKDEADVREQIMANRGAPSPKTYSKFGKQLATLFTKDRSVEVAFVDFGGWDTHVREGAGKGQLANHLSPLAQGLAELAAELGPLYKDTTILVMSEFGRTAAENGNGGTDHGHGNVMWLLGGDVQGGKVWGRWGGLSQNSLHEARDLPTTTDFRTVISSVLSNHMTVPKAGLANIFPGFQSAGNPFVQV